MPSPTVKPRLIIAGGSGFVGRALSEFFAAKEFAVVVLTRGKSEARDGIRFVNWDGKTAGNWWRELDSAAALFNLTGRNINCRFTENRREIFDSRVDSVRALADAAARCENPPPIWAQASGTGIYGDAGDRWCDENAPHGHDFLAYVCEQWEGALAQVNLPRTRKIILRFGAVLGRGEGMLAPLEKLTRAFLGGRVGSGRQFVSWIHVADLAKIFAESLSREDFCGVSNAVTPNPVTNAEFMHELRHALHRPWSPPAPEWAVKIGGRIIGTEPSLALASTRATPKHLLAKDFHFEFLDLPAALANIYQHRAG